MGTQGIRVEQLFRAWKIFNSTESLKAYLSFGLPVFGFPVCNIFEKDMTANFFSLSTHLYAPVDMEQL